MATAVEHDGGTAAELLLMGNHRDIELELARTPPPQDQVRRNKLAALYELTGRPLVAYYSAWLQKPGAPGTGIEDADLQGLMTALHGFPKDKGMDLILHTPGGGVAATEGFGKYLRQLFPNDLRVMVPQLAMSGGTLLACAAKRVVMGKHSFLGPIDPQIMGRPAQGLLEEFKKAKDDIASNPALVNAWAPLLSKYEPGLLVACENASKWSREIATKWLSEGMFAGASDAKKRAETIVNALGSHDATLAHDRHYSVAECQELGFNIELLESAQNGDLQDRLLSVHHAYTLTFARSNAIRIIENHMGIATAFMFNPQHA